MTPSVRLNRRSFYILWKHTQNLKIWHYQSSACCGHVAVSDNRKGVSFSDETPFQYFDAYVLPLISANCQTSLAQN